MVFTTLINQPVPRYSDILDWIDPFEGEPVHMHVLRNWRVLHRPEEGEYGYEASRSWDIDGRSVRLTGFANIESERWSTKELGEWPPPMHRHRRKQRSYGAPSVEDILLDPDSERVILACDWANDCIFAVFDAQGGRLIRIRNFRGFQTEGASGRGTLDDLVDQRFDFSYKSDWGSNDLAIWICGFGLLLVRCAIASGRLWIWQFDSDLQFLESSEHKIPQSELDRVGTIRQGLVLLGKDGEAHYIRMSVRE